MGNNQFCRICKGNSLSPLSVKVPGSVRLLNNNIYTVWLCDHCQTLNALEKVDYDKIYSSYPIQKQKYDFFSKKIFKKRLEILIEAGLNRTHSILDYGCGSGYFVKFLQENKFNCVGYEPYHTIFSSTETLLKKYDFVISQDVMEHVDNPHQFLENVRKLVNDNGKLIVGTPFADNVDIFNTTDQIGALHQPFHRFLISKKQIINFFEHRDWSPAKIIEKSYLDTWFPFINRKFLFNYFKSGGGIIDIGFEPISIRHFFKNPSLIFWGLFGRFNIKNQDLFIVSSKVPNS